MPTLKSVNWSVSVANFYFDGADGFSYSLYSWNIVQFSTDEKERLIVVEQFEIKTERGTKLWATPTVQVGSL